MPIDYEKLGLTKIPKTGRELGNHANYILRKLQNMLIDARIADPNHLLLSDNLIVIDVKATAGLAVVLLESVFDESQPEALFLTYAFYLGLAGLSIIAGKHDDALKYLDCANDCVDSSWEVDEISLAAYNRLLEMATTKEEYLG